MREWYESKVAEVLIDQATLQRRVVELGEQITADYEGLPLTVVVVMQGALFFAADLVRAVDAPLKMIPIQASSYHGGKASRGSVVLSGIDDFSLSDLVDRHVVLVDDVLDTGRTLRRLIDYFTCEIQVASIGVAVLLRKPTRREAGFEVDLRYCGFDVADEFVVGYGLDYQGEYRNLPFIAVLNQEVTK